MHVYMHLCMYVCMYVFMHQASVHACIDTTARCRGIEPVAQNGTHDSRAVRLVWLISQDQGVLSLALLALWTASLGPSGAGREHRAQIITIGNVADSALSRLNVLGSTWHFSVVSCGLHPGSTLVDSTLV